MCALGSDGRAAKNAADAGWVGDVEVLRRFILVGRTCLSATNAAIGAISNKGVSCLFEFRRMCMDYTSLLFKSYCNETLVFVHESTLQPMSKGTSPVELESLELT